MNKVQILGRWKKRKVAGQIKCVEKGGATGACMEEGWSNDNMSVASDIQPALAQ